MKEKKDIGFPRETKMLFKIEWKSLHELNQEIKQQLKQRQNEQKRI